MGSSDQKRSQANGRSFILKAMLVIFDIIAVNLAYFAALVIRFYVNYEFNEWALVYIPAFIKLAPGYTLFCLVVFGVFKLYNSRWRYAGLGDLNRILMASLVTCVRCCNLRWLLSAGFPTALPCWRWSVQEPESAEAELWSM